jgi:hypothetical protein
MGQTMPRFTAFRGSIVRGAVLFLIKIVFIDMGFISLSYSIVYPASRSNTWFTASRKIAIRHPNP